MNTRISTIDFGEVEKRLTALMNENVMKSKVSQERASKKEGAERRINKLLNLGRLYSNPPYCER